VDREKHRAYHVISRIGRAHGVVYRAVRVGDHFLKHVALKVVRSGIGSEDAIRRFKNERQILASSSTRISPGCSTSGDRKRPALPDHGVYRGKPVDEYCDLRRLTIPERLRLFQVICSAVQFAHQNLVVHATSSRQYTRDTGRRSKLLDFGIANYWSPALLSDRRSYHGSSAMTLNTRSGANPRRLHNDVE